MDWETSFGFRSRPLSTAAGQVFFTLSIGTGVIHTYASYLKKKQDIVLNGLSTSATNEFAEVILGGCIAIPVAYAFFGFEETIAIAQGGAFNLGFQAMPLIFQQLPIGKLLGAMWFTLLFFATITSSVALLQPAVAFLEWDSYPADEERTEGRPLFPLFRQGINVVDPGDSSHHGPARLAQPQEDSRVSPSPQGLTLGGWILLIISWGTIIGLVAFCFTKIFKK